MKDAELKELFLTKEEMKFNTIIQEYILQMRKSQQKAIQNQAPNIIGRQCNMFISLLITAAIVFLNYEQLFLPQSQEAYQLIPFRNLHEIERKIQYVFEHTLMKYTILYPVNITECEPFIFFIDSDTLCSEKSVQVKMKFIFDIGYKPDYDNLQYDPKNRSITGEYGQLQILNMAHQRLIESETNGFMNSWSILEFQAKYNQIKQALKPKLEKRVYEYIENQSQNSIDSIGSNIKKALMKIMKDKQNIKEPLSNKMINIINHTFDKLLILLSMDPLFFTPEIQKKNTFSEQDVTEFYKQQIIVEAERNKIQTQIAKIMKKQKAKKQTKTGSKQNNDQSQRQKSQPKDYNSEEIRRKYKNLLKKTQ